MCLNNLTANLRTLSCDQNASLYGVSTELSRFAAYFPPSHRIVWKEELFFTFDYGHCLSAPGL